MDHVSIVIVKTEECLMLTVQVTLALLGDPAATLLLVLLEDLDRLESLHDLPVDAAAGINVLRGPGATVLGGAVGFPQATDTDGLAHVDMASDGRGTDVEPKSRSGIFFPMTIGARGRCANRTRPKDSSTYQSMFWGGISLAGPVFTVSTQPRHVSSETGQTSRYTCL
jgi:hypothetical protein